MHPIHIDQHRPNISTPIRAHTNMNFVHVSPRDRGQGKKERGRCRKQRFTHFAVLWIENYSSIIHGFPTSHAICTQSRPLGPSPPPPWNHTTISSYVYLTSAWTVPEQHMSQEPFRGNHIHTTTTTGMHACGRGHDQASWFCHHDAAQPAKSAPFVVSHVMYHTISCCYSIPVKPLSLVRAIAASHTDAPHWWCPLAVPAVFCFPRSPLVYFRAQ